MRPGSKLTGEHLVLMAEEQHQEGEPACGTVVSATSSVRRGRSLQPGQDGLGESCAVRMSTEGVPQGLFAVGDHPLVADRLDFGRRMAWNPPGRA
ncbi:hypothetical protein DMC63_38435 [Streptomyces sp. WAC 05977]|nr:hypothetical protein DMC63_38435 [Streptomyces sp. WAC 05977]